MNLRPVVRRAVVLTALSTVWPLAACGADNTQSWVGTFCGTGSSLRKVLSDANDHLKIDLAANTPPAELRADAVRDADGVAAAAASATARMRDAGDPTVDEGKGIELAAIALFDGIEAQAKGNQITASSLSGQDADALTAGLGPYSQQVADLSGRLARSFTYIQGYKGYTDVEKASRKPDPETHIDETCAQLQAVTP